MFLVKGTGSTGLHLFFSSAFSFLPAHRHLEDSSCLMSTNRKAICKARPRTAAPALDRLPLRDLLQKKNEFDYTPQRLSHLLLVAKVIMINTHYSNNCFIDTDTDGKLLLYSAREGIETEKKLTLSIQGQGHFIIKNCTAHSRSLEKKFEEYRLKNYTEINLFFVRSLYPLLATAKMMVIFLLRLVKNPFA